MSCRLTTVTPFIDREILLKALKVCGYIYQEINGKIVLPSLSQYFGASLEKDHLGKYVLIHDSHAYIQEFMQHTEKVYVRLYQEKLEELERLRQEAERRRIEAEQKSRLLAEQKQREAEQKRLEEEQQRIEAEQKRLAEEKRIFIENQKEAIKEKAKALGYEYKEIKKENQVQLVLVRRSY